MTGSLENGGKGRPTSVSVDIELTSDFDSANFRTLFRYWQKVRGDRPRPRWTDIDLIEIYEIAPKIVVKDVVDGGTEFRNRFWGTSVTQNLGVDATGKLIREYFDRPENLEDVYAIYRTAMTSDVPVRSTGKVQFKGKEFLHYEGITLPLDGPVDGRVDHLISLYDFLRDKAV